MNAGELQTHWALLLATVTGLALLLTGIAHLFRASARGQLRRMHRALHREQAGLIRAKAVVEKAGRQKSRLLRRADRVKPRLLQESAAALEDAKALAMIAADRVMVAENHLRRVIVEEFPPTQHEKLRSRYLPEASADKRPFTF
jgi:hypothetical protein